MIKVKEFKPHLLGRTAALALVAGTLAGCVYYPSYGYYGSGYYAAPAYVAPAPTVVIGGGWGWGGGWGRHWR